MDPFISNTILNGRFWPTTSRGSIKKILTARSGDAPVFLTEPHSSRFKIDSLSIALLMKGSIP